MFETRTHKKVSLLTYISFLAPGISKHIRISLPIIMCRHANNVHLISQPAGLFELNCVQPTLYVLKN